MTRNDKLCKHILTGLLAFTIGASIPIQSACAVGPRAPSTQVENFTDQGPLVDSMIDGHHIIEAMHKHADDLNDYSLVFDMTVFKKGTVVTERGKLFFKKPQLLRLEETGQYKTGSVAVIGKDGKAHAHTGGVAKFITLTMDPDDKQLRASNGDSLKESDLASLGVMLKNLLKQGIKSRTSEKPLSIKGVGEAAYVVELYRPENPKLVLKRIFVDPITYLPVRWDDYDFKDPSASFWKCVKTNIGLTDDLFTL
jgi:outer membrane lipoprotein-sorting protein